MNYQQALEYIHSRPRMKNTDNHRAMKKLLDYMGNPQDNLKYIHIAGTNGKGSCAVMCSNILRHAGYKTGLTISPFVIDFTERISINGKYIPQETLAEITEKVKFYRDKIQQENNLQILEFELVNVIAFCYFAMEKCDVVCLEVGIGGLTDSTNIIKDCLVSCIMNISYDHTQVLGNTLSQIALQKAGIIKRGRPVVCYPAMDKEALDAIYQKANENKSQVIIPDLKSIRNKNVGFMASLMQYKELEITQSFTGVHQSYNAATVIEVMHCLREYGYNISDYDILYGIENAKFPARIELLCKNPLVILDGGHNTDGINALINVLKENNICNLNAVWASLSDKSPEKIIQMVSPYLSSLCTIDLHGARALSKESLADMARPYIKKVYTADSVEQAIDLALAEKSGLLVFGSLYLASDARDYLLKKIQKI